MKLAKSFSVYAFTLIFNAAVSFVTFSILTRYLSEVDFGIINLYTSFTIFIVPFISIGVPFTLGVDYFKMNEQIFRKHFTNGVAVPAISAVFFMLLSLILILPLTRLLKVNYFFAAIVPITCFLVFLNEVMLNMIRNKGKHIMFAIYSIIRNLSEIGLTILLVVGLGLGWSGRLWSAFLILLVFGIVILTIFRRWHLFSSTLSKSDMVNIFKIGLPFIPERLAIFVLAYSDRFFIDHFEGTGNVGYYSAGAQLAWIVNLVILTLNNTFYPHYYQKLSLAQIDYRGLRKATFTFVGIVFVAAMGVILFTPIIFHYFIGETFQPGSRYAIFLSIGFFFWGIYNAFLPYLLNLKKNKTVMIISLTGMSLSAVLNCINVKFFGAIGATYSSIIVYFFMALMMVVTVLKTYGVKKLFLISNPLIKK